MSCLGNTPIKNNDTKVISIVVSSNEVRLSEIVGACDVRTCNGAHNQLITCTLV